MVKWKFWQRSADTTTDAELPPEVQEYYESTRRGRKSVAIVLGIVTVIVTLLLAAVLYFAGRYVWQRFFDNNDEPAPITQQEATPTDAPVTPGTNTDANNDSTDQTSDASDEDTTGNDTEDNSDTSSTATDEPAEDTSDSGSSGATNNDDDSASKGSRPSSTPDTGPGEVFAVALLAAFVSGIGYELLARRPKTTR